MIKVTGLAWLEFEKPDLARAEAFAHAFGFTTVLRTADELQLRGTDAGAPCVLIRRGPTLAVRSASAFRAADDADLRRLAEPPAPNASRCPRAIGGLAVDLTDPSGLPVRVVAGTHELAGACRISRRTPSTSGTSCGAPTPPSGRRGSRHGCSGSGTSCCRRPSICESLDWYLDHLGMIVSDFLYFPGQRERGPTMSFIRCDRGPTPADHHTLAMALGPTNRYVHSAYQVRDLDALAAGGEYLLERGYHRSWGIGRHIQGSQIFDYWRDPDGFIVEHFTDGDMFDCTLEPGWAPLTASGLAQWGPPATKDFLGTNPRIAAHEARSMIGALARGQRIRPPPPASAC